MAEAGSIVERGRAEDIQFLGSFTNKLDAKGRLSVPADFRKMLESANPAFDGFLCAMSQTRPILECGGQGLIDHLMRQVDTIDVFDEEREILEEAMLGACYRLHFDDTGRIVMPAELREHCGLTTHATFAGRRGIFQIWNPDDHAARLARLPDILARHGETMRARTLPSMQGRQND